MAWPTASSRVGREACCPRRSTGISIRRRMPCRNRARRPSRFPPVAMSNERWRD